MFENQSIGVCTKDGRELMCGDIVESIYECACGEHTVRGIVEYDSASACFMLALVTQGVSVPISEFLEAGFIYLGSDAAANLGVDHPLFKPADINFGESWESTCSKPIEAQKTLTKNDYQEAISTLRQGIDTIHMRIFRIFSASGEPEFVRECDLEAILCGACHGALRKESRQESDYSRRESFLLRCQKCGGSYSATSLTDYEMRQLQNNKLRKG